MTRRTWSPAEIRALGARTDLVTACQIVYGVGRHKAWALYHAGQLAFPTLTTSYGRQRVVVPVAPLLALLGIDSEPDDQPDSRAVKRQKRAQPALRLIGPPDVA